MIPWWGWLLIILAGFAVVVFSIVFTLALKARRVAVRELKKAWADDGWINLGPPRRARSRHFTDPF